MEISMQNYEFFLKIPYICINLLQISLLCKSIIVHLLNIYDTINDRIRQSICRFQ